MRQEVQKLIRTDDYDSMERVLDVADYTAQGDLRALDYIGETPLTLTHEEYTAIRVRMSEIEDGGDMLDAYNLGAYGDSGEGDA